MDVRELEIADAYEITPRQHGDERGVFLEWYRVESLMATRGHALTIRQANCSVSAAGVVRGIHFAEVPPGQAKYVTCLSGAVVDVIVDLRVGSPTFGGWVQVQLDDVDRRAVYVAEGLGHAFMALTDAATVSYLCSEVYSPTREHGIHPLDPEIGIAWPTGITGVLSPKDAAAPSLNEAQQNGLLADYATCRDYYAALRIESKASASESRQSGEAGRPTRLHASSPSTE